MRVITDTQKLIEQMQLYDKVNGCYIPFKLWPRQIEWVNTIHTQREPIGVKKRQVGFSQLTGADSLCQCMLLDNFLVLVLSKTGDDAEVFLKRVSDMYRSLPQVLKDRAPLKPSRSGDDHPKKRMDFINGSSMLSLAASKGAGHTADRVVLDEAGKVCTKASHIELKTVLMNIAPTLDKSNGQLIMLSTAEGYNLFHQMYNKNKYDNPNSAFFFSCFKKLIYLCN